MYRITYDISDSTINDSSNNIIKVKVDSKEKILYKLDYASCLKNGINLSKSENGTSWYIDSSGKVFLIYDKNKKYQTWVSKNNKYIDLSYLRNFVSRIGESSSTQIPENSEGTISPVSAPVAYIGEEAITSDVVWVNDSLKKINLNANDEQTAIKRIDYSFTGANNVSGQIENDGEISIEGFNEGENTLKAVAYDEGDNKSPELELQINIDKTAPVKCEISLIENTEDTVKISYRLKEDISYLYNFKIYVNGNENTDIVFSEEIKEKDDQIEITHNSSFSEIYEVYIVVYDTSKNSLKSNVLSVSTNNSKWDGSSIKTTFDGLGTIGSPYLITSAEELAGLAYQVNNGEKYEGTYFNQVADIDLNGKYWTPIGIGSKCFSGIYNGGNHKIENIYAINEATAGNASNGLFGYVRNGNIENIILESGIVSDTTGYVGGIVGKLETTNKSNRMDNASIFNCINKASVSSSSAKAGGITAQINNTYASISNCFNEGKIIANGTSSTYVGGIVGWIGESSVSCCYNSKNAKIVSSASACGGIAGYVTSKVSVTNCYNSADIDGSTTTNYKTGGIVGYNSNTAEDIAKLYNFGNVTGDSKYTGAIIGGNYKSGNYAYDNYYLENSCAQGAQGTKSSNSAGATVKTSDEMKSFIINSNFKLDLKNVNNGYPILEWQ